MPAEEARLVLAHRPLWAVSALSAAPRLPLISGLFDYVVFDEASQCDIASALPLFGRARRAVVVGDPEQLGFVPQLSIRQEHALMDAAGLGSTGRHAVAQSINSLFGFAAGRPAARQHFLADQFRSDPAIVGYLNDAFYEGRLVAAQDERWARWPDGYRPGLAWHDVRGRANRRMVATSTMPRQTRSPACWWGYSANGGSRAASACSRPSTPRSACWSAVCGRR